ncbi:hypothetical protein GHT06_001863 [Daphnia sinensis]|uniref:Uncharacterized protein n=1 Tax=Daphnia sinensis TaxID=1820382 RepID=A0AAD5PLB4_9CRUS|nr:hypothetical protein GHT06_001863 [Daphnia sinensis]
MTDRQSSYRALGAEIDSALSRLTPENQTQMRNWISDGTFTQRAIDTMFEQGHEILRLEKLTQAAHQSQQEPVAWALSHSRGIEFNSKYPMQSSRDEADRMARQHLGAVTVTPLYTSPPAQPAREPLTEYQKWRMYEAGPDMPYSGWRVHAGSRRHRSRHGIEGDA